MAGPQLTTPTPQLHSGAGPAKGSPNPTLDGENSTNLAAFGAVGSSAAGDGTLPTTKAKAGEASSFASFAAAAAGKLPLLLPDQEAKAEITGAIKLPQVTIALTLEGRLGHAGGNVTLGGGITLDVGKEFDVPLWKIQGGAKLSIGFDASADSYQECLELLGLVIYERIRKAWSEDAAKAVFGEGYAADVLKHMDTEDDGADEVDTISTALGIELYLGAQTDDEDAGVGASVGYRDKATYQRKPGTLSLHTTDDDVFFGTIALKIPGATGTVSIEVPTDKPADVRMVGDVAITLSKTTVKDDAPAGLLSKAVASAGSDLAKLAQLPAGVDPTGALKALTDAFGTKDCADGLASAQQDRSSEVALQLAFDVRQTKATASLSVASIKTLKGDVGTSVAGASYEGTLTLGTVIWSTP